MPRNVLGALVVGLMLATITSGALGQAFLCSAGPADGQACATDDDCFAQPVAGACVLVQGVCDGGDYDGFPCDCPGGVCLAAGTCAGGPFDGDSCTFANDSNCGGATICIGTQRVCGTGQYKGFGCLRAAQCGDAASCISTGKFCDGGDYADYTCVDDADCNGTSTDGRCVVSSSVAPTPTPIALPCVGDCGGDGAVTVDDLIRGVNIALGSGVLATCSSFDVNGDSEVTIDEIVQAVNAALLGCVGATATPTVPVQTPTPTNTLGPASAGRAIAGRAALIANGLGAFPPLVTAILRGLQTTQTVGVSSNSQGFTTASVLAPLGTCPGGGQVITTCSGIGNVNINITFTGCTLTTDSGSVTFQSGSIGLRGAGACPNVVVPAPVLDESIQLTATFRDSGGTPKLLITADLTGSVTSIGLNTGASCFINGGDVTLTGSITAQSPGGAGSRIDFNGTAVNFLISQFNADCVPLNYRLTFNGSDHVSDPTSGDAFDAVLQNFITTQDSTTNPPQTSMSGGISSACFGGPTTLSTEIGLTTLPNSLCFGSGRLLVTAGGQQYRALYEADGSVGIDSTGDLVADETHASCTAPSLRACVP